MNSIEKGDLSRRGFLKLTAVGAILALAACGGDDSAQVLSESQITRRILADIYGIAILGDALNEDEKTRGYTGNSVQTDLFNRFMANDAPNIIGRYPPEVVKKTNIATVRVVANLMMPGWTDKSTGQFGYNDTVLYAKGLENAAYVTHWGICLKALNVYFNEQKQGKGGNGDIYNVAASMMYNPRGIFPRTGRRGDSINPLLQSQILEVQQALDYVSGGRMGSIFWEKMIDTQEVFSTSYRNDINFAYWDIDKTKYLTDNPGR